MSSKVGLRVVRGPNWKWGEQDGGEGYVGTVIPTSESDLEKLGPNTVTVLWDSGLKSTYQGGPKGFYDLRIINNSALGVKHPNIPCGDDSCWVQEIQGIRWECVTCGINLCTNCFLKKEPHNIEHVQFKRYNHDRVTRPPIVSCWGAGGPDSRIELKGIFPGATVSMGPEWPYEREEEVKNGLVIAAPKEEVLGKILVEWLPTKERTRHERSSIEENMVLCLKEPGFNGFYHAGAFSILEFPKTDGNSRPVFSFGDRVQIDPALKLSEFRKRQTDHGGYINGMKECIGIIGTVQCTDGSSVSVDFQAQDEGEAVSWRFNPTILKKLNKFSVNQVIRIRNDERTIRSIENKFDEPEIRQKLIGSTGRITDVDENDPALLFVLFDSAEIYQWLSKTEALPSGWMEPLESSEPAVEKELAEFIKKSISLFFDAIKRGDLRTAKLLHLHRTTVVDARSTNGKTALQIACWKGHSDIVKWLLDEVKVDVEQPDKDGNLPIHYAVDGCMPDVLKLLIERGVNLNSKDDEGKTPLDYAILWKFTECSRLLIDAGCDINIQNSDGETALHVAVLHRNMFCVSQILSRISVNYDLEDKDGFNIIQFAVVLNNLEAIELLMGQEKIQSALLKYMPDRTSTVLHYACTHKNYRVAKLLIEKSRRWTLPDGSSLLTQLLEMPNGSGMTALAIACHQKDAALIELLVNSGANIKARDEQEENTGILLVACSCQAEEIVPTQDVSPAIFKIYQSLNHDPDLKDVENKTILSLILYLISKGCCVNTANKSGLKLSDLLLLDKGYPANIIELLIQFIQKSREDSSGGSGSCMGRTGCVQQPAFQFYCPHKPICRACSSCFSSKFEESKCGCQDEKILPIPNASSSSSAEASSLMDATQIKEDPGDYGFKWVSDGSKNGNVVDRMGNTYTWNSTRRDGSIGFRCSYLSGTKGRCPAVARRISNGNGEDDIQLESPHKHSTEKRKADCVDDQEGNPSTPSVKKRRSVNPDN